ncbi:hypothetical protein L195_g046306, partial [Trifolium pratense]
MQAIEIVFHKRWSNFWLETDSTLVVTTFKNPAKPVAWPEVDQVADLLANHAGYVILQEKLPNYVVPDLTGFK